MTQLSHRHHYVPQWYQRRFLGEGQTAFKILDLKPEVFRDKTGKVRGQARSILDKGPDAHFWEPHLYSVRWLGRSNDDIERWLFGAIDRAGQTAIDAFIAEDWNTVHHTYWQVYEFMDALRLRTPKGLRFVAQMSKKDDQLSVTGARQLLERLGMHLEQLRRFGQVERSHGSCSSDPRERASGSRNRTQVRELSFGNPSTTRAAGQGEHRRLESPVPQFELMHAPAMSTARRNRRKRVRKGSNSMRPSGVPLV